VAFAVAAPSYQQYVASLPGGLEAYPEAQAKGALVRSVLLNQPRGILCALPEPVRLWVTDPPLDNDWVSEAAYGALIHAVAEARGWREPEIREWTMERNRNLFSGPLYRTLMRGETPEAMFRHAGLRWANFHRGSTLNFLGFSDDGARVGLAFPKGLFDALLLRAYGAVFCAALQLAHAKTPVAVLEEEVDGFARYCTRW
jgi:hypothetical protein